MKTRLNYLRLAAACIRTASRSSGLQNRDFLVDLANDCMRMAAQSSQSDLKFDYEGPSDKRILN